MVLEKVSGDQGKEISVEEIREEFIEKIKAVYPDDDVHGFEHALEVEEMAMEVLERARAEAEERGEEFEVNELVLRLVALGHDVGHAVERDVSHFTHIEKGFEVLTEILDKIDYLSVHERNGILILERTHDDTVYTYPFKEKEGKPFLTEKQKKQRERQVREMGFLNELKVLREADSFLATGEIGFARTVEYGEKRERPFFALEGDPLQADIWGVSIVGDIRLNSRQAFEDAFTQEGKRLALEGWVWQEREIERRYNAWKKEGDFDFYSDPELVEVIYGEEV